jgi:hypothetical protein
MYDHDVGGTIFFVYARSLKHSLRVCPSPFLHRLWNIVVSGHSYIVMNTMEL